MEVEALATKISGLPVGSSASMLPLASLALNEQNQKHDRILIIVGRDVNIEFFPYPDIECDNPVKIRISDFIRAA